MPKWIYALLCIGLIAFVIAGCTGTPQNPTGALATPLATQAMQSTATAEPTATATPWYDLPATQASIDAAKAEADKAQAEKDLLILQMTKDSADVTNRLALDESNRQSLELEAWIELAQAGATATQQAAIYEHELAAQEIEIEARKTGMIEIAVWVGVALAITGALFIMLRAWRSVDYRESGESVDDENETVQTETHNAGYMEVMQLEDKDTIILRNAAERIAYHMTGLMSYRSVNEDCPDEAQRILRAEWTDVRAVLIDKKYNLAKEQVGGIQMSDAGIKVINGLLPR